MGLVFHSGFETGDLGEWDSTVGSPTVQSDTKHTGDYACEFAGYPTRAVDYIEVSGAARRIALWFFLHATQEFECGIIGDCGTTLSVALTSDRYIKLYDGVSLKGTGSTQLVLETQYHICLSSTSESARVYLNGSVEINTVAVSDNAPACKIGGMEGAAGDGKPSIKWDADDVVFDDTASTDDLGDIRVLRSQPDADGTNKDFGTREPTNSRPYFGLVNECPVNDANYVSNEEDPGTDKEETFALPTCSGLGIGASDTIEAVSVWCRMDKGTGKASTHQLVVYDEQNYEYTVTFSKTFGWKNEYMATRPGGGVWSQGAFDAFEAGAGNAGDGGQDTFLGNVMAMIAYKVVAAPPPAYIPRHSGTVGVLMI